MVCAASIQRTLTQLRTNVQDASDRVSAAVRKCPPDGPVIASSLVLGGSIAATIGSYFYPDHSGGNLVTEFLNHRATLGDSISHRWTESARALRRGATACAVGYVGYRAAQLAFDVLYAPDTGPVLETLAEEPDFGIFCPIEEPLDGKVLSEDQADQLKWEQEVAEVFSPADGLGGLSRHSRNLLRYWVERVYEKFPLVRDDEGDKIVVYKRVREWMAQKGYRLEDRAKMADIVVGLAIAGTTYRENAHHIVRASKRRTWVEWLLRRKSGSMRVGK